MKIREIFPPRNVPLLIRVSAGLISAGILMYGLFGIWNDDLFMPGKYTGSGSTGGVHFRGIAAWLMFGALACPVVWLLTRIVYHYDRRNNEEIYRRCSKWLYWAWWILVIAALIAQLLVVPR
ncbi:MAG: hypothetical protein U1F61_01935 [Opitutaceae bacterium]